MNFEIVHVFTNIDRDRYVKLFFDETFNEAMKPAAGLKSRQLMEQREEGNIWHRRTRVVPIRDFPAPLNKFIKGELSYVEDTSYDRATFVQKWDSKVSVLTDKLKLRGETRFTQVGSGVERRISGEVTADVFGVGRIIEKTIVDNIKETYDSIAKFTQSYINDGKAP